MSNTKKTYKAKLLLFGEYTVISGSDALAMPCDLFFGHWDFNKKEAGRQRVLYELLKYLSKLEFQEVHFQELSFKKALDSELYFNSNIPIGYGAGSSGALCAAVFDQFYQKDNALDMFTLKKILGEIENFFHGSSSGLDPLICYLDKAVKLHDGKINSVSIPENKSPYHFFLLDTGIPRKTEPLVNLHLKKIKSDEGFNILVSEKLSALNNLAIKAYLSDDRQSLFQTLHEISLFQSEYFKEMIPESCIEIWQKGLDSTDFKIKLCGAGGGGFLLGMTNNYEKTKGSVSHFNIIKAD